MPMINEVVVEPKGIPADQFIEIYTNTGSPFELRNWTLEFTDIHGLNIVLTLNASTMVMSGRYAIIKNPGDMDKSTSITLRDTTHRTIDTVDLAAIQAAIGFATGLSNEAIARIPDGINTFRITNFQRQPASIGGQN